MRKWKRLLISRSVLLLILVTLGPLEARGQLPGRWSGAVRADAVQPAGAPILFTVALTNTGDTPIEYGSLEPYPDANWFRVRISDSTGKVREVEPTNYIAGELSVAIRKIEPGKSVDMPAVIDPLPSGSYTIQMRNGKSARVVVREGPELVRKRDQEILSRIRKGDPFALHVAAKYGGKSLIDALLHDLLSDDAKSVFLAAFPLARVPELPPNSAALITNAMRKELALVKKGPEDRGYVLMTLAYLAARVGSDETLEAVLALARTKEVRASAVSALSKFKQEKAVQELRRFLKDEHDGIQFQAAQSLARRNDPAALEVLLAVAYDPKSHWRAFSFEALLKYSDDPRIEAAIKSGLNDTDSFVRGQAEFALRNLRPVKKP